VLDIDHERYVGYCKRKRNGCYVLEGTDIHDIYSYGCVDFGAAIGFFMPARACGSLVGGVG
jgi:hypothetical protein